MRAFSIPGLLLGCSLALTACGELPAARTNCWTSAGSASAEVSQAAIQPGTLAVPAPVDPSTCD